MLERDRLESKKISKTQSVMSQLETPLEPDDVHVGPSDYVPWLTDRKIAYIRLEGTTFGGVPLSAEVKLEVWDSPNSAAWLSTRSAAQSWRSTAASAARSLALRATS